MIVSLKHTNNTNNINQQLQQQLIVVMMMMIVSHLDNNHIDIIIKSDNVH